ncbi:MAG: hypothetical protein ABI855_09530, partial [Bacteroidota bacterium]
MKKHTEEQLMAAAELEPENPQHLYRIACLIYENKEIFNHYSKASELIYKAQALNPLNGEYHFKLAAMHTDNQCWNQVYRHLKSCIELDYKPRKCEKLLKETKIKEEEYETKSKGNFVTNMESEPDNPRNLAQLGHHYCHKDKEKAYAYYKKAQTVRTKLKAL